ncbi:uncharacterized protein LOC143286385 [Babylonia areolata]|uniref:uncharacterized protein LOC143286385 n=1 Tax=Babylonia areolata TaxID=304850 RepID=UPI003FD13C08
MAKIYDTVKSCLYKSPGPQQVEVITDVSDIKESDSKTSLSSSSSSSLYSNKKTDETTDPNQQGGILWRVTSGVYSTATGAVGAGIGGVRWVAGKTYDVGSAVASKVPVPGLGKKKDKNE